MAIAESRGERWTGREEAGLHPDKTLATGKVKFGDVVSLNTRSRNVCSQHTLHVVDVA